MDSLLEEVDSQGNKILRTKFPMIMIPTTAVMPDIVVSPSFTLCQIPVLDTSMLNYNVPQICDRYKRETFRSDLNSPIQCVQEQAQSEYFHNLLTTRTHHSSHTDSLGYEDNVQTHKLEKNETRGNEEKNLENVTFDVSVEEKEKCFPSMDMINKTIQQTVNKVLMSKKNQFNLPSSDDTQSKEHLSEEEMDKETIGDDYLPMHENDSAISCGKITCEVCGLCFQYKSELLVHTLLHMKNSEPQFLCGLCSKPLNSEKFHICDPGEQFDKLNMNCQFTKFKTNVIRTPNKTKTVHVGKKPIVNRHYLCEFCGKAFKGQGELDTHQRTHTGERPNSCFICEKKFNDRSALIRHIRTHTDDKPYQCSVCGKQFNRSCGLSDHKKTHVNSTKPYQCDMCDKSFFYKCRLDTHMRVHLNTKPFKCNICGTGFNHNASLKNHMKNWHKE